MWRLFPWNLRLLLAVRIDHTDLDRPVVWFGGRQLHMSNLNAHSIIFAKCIFCMQRITDFNSWHLIGSYFLLHPTISLSKSVFVTRTCSGLPESHQAKIFFHWRTLKERCWCLHLRCSHIDLEDMCLICRRSQAQPPASVLGLATLPNTKKVFPIIPAVEDSQEIPDWTWDWPSAYQIRELSLSHCSSPLKIWTC